MSSAVRALAWYVTGLVFELWLRFDFLQYLLNVYFSKNQQILETGQEMNELDHSGFSTQTTTIFAGNIGGDRYIVQVSDTSLRLLEGGECQFKKKILHVLQVNTLCLALFVHVCQSLFMKTLF